MKKLTYTLLAALFSVAFVGSVMANAPSTGSTALLYGANAISQSHFSKDDDCGLYTICCLQDNKRPPWW